jgi:hypothetical protein
MEGDFSVSFAVCTPKARRCFLPPAPPSGYGTLKQGLHEEAVPRKMAPGRDQRRSRRPLLPRRHQSIWQAEMWIHHPQRASRGTDRVPSEMPAAPLLLVRCSIGVSHRHGFVVVERDMILFSKVLVLDW